MNTLEVYSKGAKTWNWGFVSVYPITMTLGFILTFLTIAYFWRRQKYSWESLEILLIATVPSSILGARTWYLLFPPAGVTADWSLFFRFEGLAIQGGVMAAVIGASSAWFFMRHTIDYRTAFGFIIPATLLGQAIGRWGNFANHEVFGNPVGGTVTLSELGSYTTQKLDVGEVFTFRNPNSDALAKLSGDSLSWLTFIKPQMLIEVGGKVAYRQPFFFYESILNFLGLFILVWTLGRKNWFKPGTSGALYFVWYGIVRMIMEPLRDNSDIMKAGSIDLSFLFSILWILAGIGIFIWFEGFTKPFDKWFIYLLELTDKIFNKMVVWWAHLLKFIYKLFGKKFKKSKGSKTSIYDFVNKHVKKTYKPITPIKPRKKAFFGEKVDYVNKWFWFFGPKRDNRVKIWLVGENKSWSKREINQGHKNK